MKKIVLTALFTIVCTFTAQAAAPFKFTPQGKVVGLYLGGQVWQSEVSGLAGEINSLIDFNLKKEQQVNYFFAIEHPFPLLPNIRVSHTKLDTTGNVDLTQDFSFGGETFPDDDDINVNFNVSYIDYSLYYQVLASRLLSLDFGVTARDFKGGVTVTGPTSLVGICVPTDIPNHCIVTTSNQSPTGKIKTNEMELMLYVDTNIRMPLIRLSVFAQGDISLKESHYLYDYQVGFRYNLADNKSLGLNLTLGYKVVEMKLENFNNLYTELEFKGAFVGVVSRF